MDTAKLLAELEFDNAQLRLKIVAADIMAVAIDYDVHAGLIATRTRITDRRENYGDPFSAEESQRLLRMEDHPHELRASMVHIHADNSETIRRQAAEIARLRAMLKRWVSEPWDMSGWDNPHCLEEQRQELEDACEIHGVDLPEWWTAERKDGAE